MLHFYVNCFLNSTNYSTNSRITAAVNHSRNLRGNTRPSSHIKNRAWTACEKSAWTDTFLSFTVSSIKPVAPARISLRKHFTSHCLWVTSFPLAPPLIKHSEGRRPLRTLHDDEEGVLARCFAFVYIASQPASQHRFYRRRLCVYFFETPPTTWTLRHGKLRSADWARGARYPLKQGLRLLRWFSGNWYRNWKLQGVQSYSWQNRWTNLLNWVSSR